MISVTLAKQHSILDDTIFLEEIDISTLKSLINSNVLSDKYDMSNYSQKVAATLYSNEKHQLECYAKKYEKKTKCIQVKYKKPTHKWGRVFPWKSLGLTCFAKKTRNTLIRENYCDIDLSNAQPCITYNICKANNIPCEYVERYINQRDSILVEVISAYNVSRSQAKTLFIHLAFCGTFYGWLQEFK